MLKVTGNGQIDLTCADPERGRGPNPPSPGKSQLAIGFS